MEDAVRQRLRQFVKTKGITVVASAIGYKQSTFSSKLTGERGLDITLFARLLAYYPELSAEWLMRGTGSMELQPTAQDEVLRNVCVEQAKEIYLLRQQLASKEQK